MSTFLHGIGSVQFLDKSAELVDLKGLDITSLAKTGTVGYEHKADSPMQIIGKILKAKKIFKESDCADENELHFWKKVKTPYLYLMAELLDDYCDSAKHVAGILRYDRDKKTQNENAISWFSVEGSEIQGTRSVSQQVVSRGIARKVTYTTAPCNSGCAIEILENQAPQVKDDFADIFKSDEEAITLFKSGEGAKLYEVYLAKKEKDAPFLLPVSSKAPKTFGQNPKKVGIKIGQTKSGKDVHSHGKVGEYGFNSAEHKEASELHGKEAVKAGSLKLADNHIEKMKLHNQAALTAQVRERGKLQKDEAPPPSPSPSPDMSASPPEPNKANAAAMQAGATSGGPTFSQAMSNLKEGLGFGKAEGEQKYHIHVKGQRITDKPMTIREIHSAYHKTPKDMEKNPDTRLIPHREVPLAKALKTGDMPVDRPKKFNHPSGHSYYQVTTQAPGPYSKTQEYQVHHWPHDKEKNPVQDSWVETHPSLSSAHAHIKELQGGEDHYAPKKDIKKALEADMSNAAPSTLIQGAAYQKESLGSKQARTGAENHSFQGTKKKDWNRMAKDEYERWPQREKFEKFMKARMPHLHDGEIRAIGRTLALKKSIDAEKALGSLVKTEALKKSQKIDLVHYSSHPNLTEVDPKHQGSGVDSRTKGRGTWHPHSFYYRAGSEPESLVVGQSPHKYHASIDTSKQPIYDIGTDKEGHLSNSSSMDEAHEKIKAAGHHGFTNSKHDSLSNVVAMYHPLKVHKSEDGLNKSEKISTPAQEHVPVSHGEFHAHLGNAIKSSPKIKDFVHQYEPHEYSKMKTFLHPDKKSGFAVKPDGDIVSVFSTEKGRGGQIMQHAKRAGGSKLDFFNSPHLKNLYEKHGFKEHKREKNWTPGGPDVVHMKLHSKE